MRVVITGANRGIGLGLARAFVERGDEVWAAARRPSEAKALNELAPKADGRLHLVPLDVVKDADCQKLGESLAGLPVDALINNAGVGGRYTLLREMDPEKAKYVFDVNALGPLRVTRALWESLKAAAPGAKVMNITSTMGSVGDNSSGRAYEYRMSKAALNIATKNLAIEGASEGITAFVVNPGWVQTDMGGPQAPTPVEEAVGNLVALLDRVRPEDAGRFFHARGHELPW